MRANFIKTYATSALGTIFFLTTQVYLLGLTKSFETKKYLFPPPQQMEWFTFGFRLSLADSIWLRWVQDSDYCQTYGSAPEMLGDQKQFTDVAPEMRLTFNPRHKKCDRSWGFLMLDMAARLDPKFEMLYQGGAIMLSVVVEDYDGASVMFERGLKAFPKDWRLAYLASYHYLYDKQDLKRAAELLLKAGELGAPSWVNSLAARLYSKEGQFELGLRTLENYEKQLTDEAQRVSVRARIEDLRRQMNSKNGP